MITSRKRSGFSSSQVLRVLNMAHIKWEEWFSVKGVKVL
jgi:hypothetical protein